MFNFFSNTVGLLSHWTFVRPSNQTCQFVFWIFQRKNSTNEIVSSFVINLLHSAAYCLQLHLEKYHK